MSIVLLMAVVLLVQSNSDGAVEASYIHRGQDNHRESSSSSAAAAAGSLPKSRAEIMREERERHKLQVERERQKEEDARKKKEAAHKWKMERERLREIYLAKMRAEERAREEQLKKEREHQAMEDREKEQQQSSGPDDPVSGEHHGKLGDELDCFGVIGGPARRDACGVCEGDGSSCSDCLGVPHGTAKPDCAGVCNGKDYSCVDCAGVMNGDMRNDVCGICGGDGTRCLDCAGVVNGTAVEDDCGVCAGDGSSCADCHGIPNGPAQMDPCGVCDGDGSSCCSPMIQQQQQQRNERSAAAAANGQNRMTDGMNPLNPLVLCNGHGTCSYEHHFCMCDSGWTGPFCTVRQNMCLHHGPNPCNGHGTCDPDTGLCRCYNPLEWMGPRCEFSRCSMRGAYDLKTGRCRCEHGYGGQFCESCAAAHPSPGKSHLCLQIVGAWQPVPEGMRLPESILLGEKNPRAPVFSMIDVKDHMADAYVSGNHLLNIASHDKKTGKVVRRAAIWPNSTHEDSGYYYDCGCRLFGPPPSARTTGYEDSGEHTSDASKDESKAVIAMPRKYRPRFAQTSLDYLYDSADSKRMALRAQEMRGLSLRAPVTLSECQDLLQEVLDEFGHSIDASTAESSELSEVVGNISSNCDHSFGITLALLAMLSAIVIAGLTAFCLYFARKYVEIKQPFQDM